MTTITLPRAVVEQALEALIIAWQQQPRWQITESMHNLRAALAQQAHTDDLNQRIKLYVGSRCAPPQQAEPVQEPVAWLRVIDEAMVTHHLGVADPGDDYETAKRKMNNLLCMAQDIGTYFAK